MAVQGISPGGVSLSDRRNNPTLAAKHLQERKEGKYDMRGRALKDPPAYTNYNSQQVKDYAAVLEAEEEEEERRRLEEDLEEDSDDLVSLSPSEF